MAVVKMTSVSVIIPTAGQRNDFLERAIYSTRPVDERISVQVLVVANGASSGNVQLPALRSRPTVSHSITVIDAGRVTVGGARNIGIAASRGELIRFLDDDDYLIPEVATHQYLELAGSAADLSTYAGRIEDEFGNVHQIVPPDGCDDYGCAVLGPRCPALTFATVYRASLVRDLLWHSDWTHTEDEHWMRCILQVGEPAWIQSDDVVGVWYQHGRERLSKPYPAATYYMNRATSILDTVAVLRAANRLTNPREHAAASGLWSAIHGGFYFSPAAWARIASIAAGLDPDARPDSPAFAALPRWCPPVLLEWIALPKRWLNHAVRIARGRLLGWNSVRKIP